MASDPTSPIVPARISTLILPFGRVRRKNFHIFVERIRKEDEIRLGDTSPNTSPTNKTLFSPLAFPNGRLLYSYSLSLSPTHHLAFSPFELHRQPLLVLCVADNAELRVSEEDDDDELLRSKLDREIQGVCDRFPRALHVQLLVFDVDSSSSARYIPQGGKAIPPPSQSKSTTMKTIICDVSAVLLSEMSIKAKSIQQATSLETLGFSLDMSSLEAAVSMSNLEARPSVSPRSNSTPIDERASSSVAGMKDSRPTSPVDSENHHNSQSTGATGGDSPRVSSPRSSSVLPRHVDPPATPSLEIPAELAKARLKTRQGILFGTLYLHSGRWPDALRELTEHTTRAKAIGDYRWFAKGLENILITLLLLAWVDMEFTIPSICFTSPRHDGSNVASDIRPSTDAGNRKTLHQLSLATPEIINLVVSSHARADSNDNSGKGFPGFIVSDCIIRLARLETVLYHGGGILDRGALSRLVSKNPRYSATTIPTSKPSSNSRTKREISSLLFRAFPAAKDTSESASLDNIILLSRIASVLSFAGLERKQALIYREILFQLTPALIRARKRGAAELGVHPAASLSNLQGFRPTSLVSGEQDNKTMLDSCLYSLIDTLCIRYGIQLELTNGGTSTALLMETSENYITAALQDAWLKSFGSVGMKSDILKLCINFCEALPNLERLMHVISTTFSITGPNGFASLVHDSKIPARLCAPVGISGDEQARLGGKFFRLVDTASFEEIKDIGPPYWDKFLIRNVELEISSDDRTLLPRTGSAFSTSAASTASKPRQRLFLHDAINRASVDSMQQVLVAGESATFIVTFQNPYNFELVVEHLEFITEEVNLEVTPSSLTLGPCLLHKERVLATPTTPGNLLITGCRVKLHGCRHQKFLIFRHPWSPSTKVKMKQSGSNLKKDLPSRDTNLESRTTSESTPPRATTFSFAVLQMQPLLNIIATSLPQSSVTLLAGQVLSFSVTLKNQSPATMCDFVSISFQQTVHGKSSSSSSSTGASVFKQQHNFPSGGQGAVSIPPEECQIFALEIYGTPGLSEGSVIFNYSHLGCSIVDMKEKFYTRRVQVQWDITVIPTTQLLRVDAIPYDENLPSGVEIPSLLATQSDESILENSRSNTCARRSLCSTVLLLDLRNTWSRPLYLSFCVKDGEMHSRTYRSRNMMVHADQVTRVALPLPRITVEDLPTPMDKNKTNHHVQLTREALLSRIEGSWKDSSNALRGIIDLQGLRLSPKIMQVICEKQISLDLAVSNDTSRCTTTNPPHFIVNQLLTVTVSVKNLTSRTLGCTLRLNSSFTGQPPTADPARHIIWSGAQWRHLIGLKAGHACQLSTGLAFLIPGRYDIQALMHEKEMTPSTRLNMSSEDIGIHSGKRARLLASSVVFISVVEA